MECAASTMGTAALNTTIVQLKRRRSHDKHTCCLYGYVLYNYSTISPLRSYVMPVASIWRKNGGKRFRDRRDRCELPGRLCGPLTDSRRYKISDKFCRLRVEGDDEDKFMGPMYRILGKNLVWVHEPSKSFCASAAANSTSVSYGANIR